MVEGSGGSSDASRAVIEKNIVQNANVGIRVGLGATNFVTVANNRLVSNTNAGVLVDAGTGNKVSQNTFSNNGLNSIDLRTGDTVSTFGVTRNTALLTGSNCPTSLAASNNAIPRPRLTKALVTGTSVDIKGMMCNTGTYDIEVYETTPGTGDFGSIEGNPTTCANPDGPTSSSCSSAGEGTKYLGTLTATGGTFSGVLSGVTPGATSFSALAIRTGGAGAIGDTSEFSSQATNPANILLVKRITAVNGLPTNPNDNTALDTVVDDTTSANDNHPNWPSGYLKGAIDAGKVVEGDEVEYTIYFLNAGGRNARAAQICSEIQPNQVFQVDKYGTDQGMMLKMGSDADVLLTNSDDPVIDRAQYISGSNGVPKTCNIHENKVTNGAVIVDLAGTTGEPSLTAVPFSTDVGTPNNSYGFIRFTTKVQP
jgi:parallel beta-helix repeat protein